MRDSLTNHVFFSAYFTEKDTKCRKTVEEVLTKNQIPFSTIYGTKDIWARDYMPVQIENNLFVRFNYEPKIVLIHFQIVIVSLTAKVIKIPEMAIEYAWKHIRLPVIYQGFTGLFATMKISDRRMRSIQIVFDRRMRSIHNAVVA